MERNSTQFAESFAIGHLASQDGHPAHWPCAANWPYILAMIAFQYVCANIPRLRIWTANSLNVWHLPKIVFFSLFRCLWRGIQGQLWPWPPSTPASFIPLQFKPSPPFVVPFFSCWPWLWRFIKKRSNASQPESRQRLSMVSGGNLFGAKNKNQMNDAYYEKRAL